MCGSDFFAFFLGHRNATPTHHVTPQKRHKKARNVPIPGYRDPVFEKFWGVWGTLSRVPQRISVSPHPCQLTENMGWTAPPYCFSMYALTEADSRALMRAWILGEFSSPLRTAMMLA